MDALLNMICDLAGLDELAAPVAATQLGWLIAAGWTGLVTVTPRGEVFVADGTIRAGVAVHVGVVASQAG